MARSLAGRLRFSPAVIAHLGELLVPAIDVALAELVKNSYDADATTCDITVTGRQARTQTIVIRDDGAGMDLGALRDSWLLIGRSGKSRSIKTKRHQRIPLGEKGLGRLAALRLGRAIALETRPAVEPGVLYRMEINWDKVDRAKTLDAIKFAIQRLETDEPPGTTIRLTRLRTGLGVNEIQDLSERLALLQGPFERRRDFKVTLNHPRFATLIAQAGVKYLDDADYHLVARLNRAGKASYELFDWSGRVLASGSGSRVFRTTSAKFEMWMYLLDAQRFTARPRTLSLAARRRWFEAFGGVYIFEGPLRVAPYGGPGDDWLGLNLRRVSNPEERPSTNNSVGRIVVSPSTQMLQQKTDRLGYITNAAFRELREFAEEALGWAAAWRLKQAEARRRTKRRATEAAMKIAREALVLSTEGMPALQRRRVERAADKLIAIDRERDEISVSERQLYRSLATIGMLGTSFAHELEKPLNVAKENLPSVQKLLEGQTRVTRQLNLLSSALDRVEPFVTIPLTLIKRDTRRARPIRVFDAISGIFNLFDPLISGAGIVPELPKDPVESVITGTSALLDSVFANLISNSINAFQRSVATAENRKIRVRVQARRSRIYIFFADNAGGIDGIDVDDIWLPGRTTLGSGNGFGLTIVKDCVSDLNGTIEVQPLSSYGGAEFICSLPEAE